MPGIRALDEAEDLVRDDAADERLRDDAAEDRFLDEAAGVFAREVVLVDFAREGRVAVVREPDGLAADEVAEVCEPDLRALAARVPAVLVLDALTPEPLVRVVVFRDAVLALVALPASAISSHPPAHVPERVVRLSPRCFREWAPPSVTPQIQTELFPGHGGAMG